MDIKMGADKEAKKARAEQFDKLAAELFGTPDYCQLLAKRYGLHRTTVYKYRDSAPAWIVVALCDALRAAESSKNS